MWGVRDGAGTGLLSNHEVKTAGDGPVGLDVGVTQAPPPPTLVLREVPPAPPPCAAGPDRCRARSAEHEARGLLNAIGLLTRCLEVVPSTPDERAEWQREIRDAGERLEQLYAAGLDRNFRDADR